MAGSSSGLGKLGGGWLTPMASFTCLVVGSMSGKEEDDLAVCPASSSRLAWAHSHARDYRATEEQHTSTFQVFASVTFAIVLLTKASHTGKPRVSVGGKCSRT